MAPAPLPAAPARELLLRFLRQQQTQMQCKLLLACRAGAYACGYANEHSPAVIRALHIETTDRLVGLVPPAKAHNWVGEFEGCHIDFSSLELGPALRQLLQGDGSVLERILAPGQLLAGHDVQQLQRVTRERALSRRFHLHYREFFKRALREDDEEHRSVAHLLGIYRLGLTGVHLLSTGELMLDLTELASAHGLAQISELVDLNRRSSRAVLDESNPWIRRLVRVHTLLDDACERSPLPHDPPSPSAVEEYLMDMRRRFFDAMTVVQ